MDCKRCRLELMKKAKDTLRSYTRDLRTISIELGEELGDEYRLLSETIATAAVCIMDARCELERLLEEDDE